ncbi:MAG: hypothetical protein J2P57_09240 [Acidimicrobiaceae bacterium]|nr:hypothetical protein [Acidimicrobiaceae bacterium]
MNLPGLPSPSDLPAAGVRVPGFAVRVAFTAVGLALSLVDYQLTAWLTIAIVLAIAAAWVPRYLVGWGLILFLALGQLTRHLALTWRFLVLLAGVHLLHTLAMLALELPWRSWVQPAVFVPPLIRFVAIQVPTQALAVVTLSLLAPTANGHRPFTVAAFAVIGSLALAGLVLLLFREGSSKTSVGSARRSR